MVCALKRIAVEVHNVAVHDRDSMRNSSLSGLDYTTHIAPQFLEMLTSPLLEEISVDSTMRRQGKPLQIGRK